jgi:hypothetical protein
MPRPSFGGVGALRGGDYVHQHRHRHLRQEAHVLALGGPGQKNNYFCHKKYNINLKIQVYFIRTKSLLYFILKSEVSSTHAAAIGSRVKINM